MPKNKITFDTNVAKKKPAWKRILFRTLFVLVAIVLIIGTATIGVGAGLVSALTKDEKVRGKSDFDKELENLSQTSSAFFRNEDGKTVKVGDMINPDDRQLVTDLNQVSPFLIDAFLSIEDREFYQHNGIVPRSLVRAVFQQAVGSDVTTGGSTLTQQLVKTHFLDYKDKSYKRKVVEIINALRVEKYYGKTDIFKQYINSVFFGSGAHGKKMYGVNAAARGLFNLKSVDLNLAQAAYIAGMAQRPNGYNPFRGDEELQYGKQRMKLVLDKMLELKKINKAEYDKALAFDIKGSLAKPSMFTNGFNKYPFIITAVEDEAIEILREQDHKNPNAPKRAENYYSNKVREGGLRFYTTIDQKMYEKVNEAGDSIHYPTRQYKGRKIKEQIGATLIDNKTGGILAFYAGKFDENEKNHALQTTNQPGSAIKPLIAYGPALNEGVISPYSTVLDEPLRKYGTNKVYRNSDGKYRGAVNATDALKKSLNIPAIKIFRQLNAVKGEGTAFDYLKKMGITPDDKYDTEALTLGGAYHGFTVNEMTAGFAMIANNGKWNKGHVIDKIVTAEGEVLYDFKRDHPATEVFKPQVAYQLTKMLRSVVTSGTGTMIGGGTSAYNVAGKTGTTTSEWDLWFVGYTPEVSMGVWSGYDYNKVGNKFLAKTAWVKLFRAAAEANPEAIPKGSNFKNPGGSIDSQCFECNKKSSYTPEKKKEKKKERTKKKNPETPTPETPPQPEGTTSNGGNTQSPPNNNGQENQSNGGNNDNGQPPDDSSPDPGSADGGNPEGNSDGGFLPGSTGGG